MLRPMYDLCALVSFPEAPSLSMMRCFFALMNTAKADMLRRVILKGYSANGYNGLRYFTNIPTSEIVHTLTNGLELHTK